MFTFPISQYSPNNKTYIKSVQHLSITILSGGTSKTATINSVNTTYSVTLLNGFSIAGDPSIDFKSQLPRVEFTNSTTITAFINTAGTTDLTAYVCVIEFYPAAITSIQRGTTSFISSDTSKVVTITSVTTANAALFWNGYTTSGGGITGANLWRAALTSATQVTWNASLSGNSGTLSWCVVEFNSSIINNIQKISATSALAAANTDTTITSVVTGNSLSLWGGMTSQQTGGPVWANIAHYGFLQSATNFRFTRVGAVDNVSRTMNATVVEFKSSAVKSVQASQINIPVSTTTVNTTITAVGKNYSFTSMCGFSNDSAVPVSSGRVFPGTFINTTTSETSVRGTGTTSSTTAAWEVIELN